MSQLSFSDLDSVLIQDVARKVAERCDELAAFTEHSDGLTRTFCSPAMRKTYDQVAQWMQQAGMSSTTDAMGNLIGQLDRDDNEQIFMTGSHLDTVVNAGRFDGTLGLLLGVAMAEVMSRAEIELNFNLHVVGFSEEEGVRFKLPFIGSRGIAGTFDSADFERTDSSGVTVREALLKFGCAANDCQSASYANRNVIGFMEAHIEQAVQLQQSDAPLGVVRAIAGQSRASIVFEGTAGHAGTVPHEQRRDALAAAAELILEIERLGQATEGLFATVGQVQVSPGLSNVISGRAELWLDLRHENDDVRCQAFQTIEQKISAVSSARNVEGRIEGVQQASAVQMDSELTAILTAAAEQAGSKTETMISGAGHDAMIMANLAPVCMLFIRCRDGVSHHPDEFVTPEDIEVALRVMVTALLKPVSYTHLTLPTKA